MWVGVAALWVGSHLTVKACGTPPASCDVVLATVMPTRPARPHPLRVLLAQTRGATSPDLVVCEVKSQNDSVRRHQLQWFQRLADSCKVVVVNVVALKPTKQ